jgi:hypothetical protein
MADNFIVIEVKGLKELQAAMDKFPQKSASYMSQAGQQAFERVIKDTKGLEPYPDETAANMPPEPYYIRGRGTQTKSGNRGNSRKMNTQWYAKREGYATRIGNSASYAQYVIGDNQAHFMAPKGWLKLVDVAKDKIKDIVKVYEDWTDKLLKDIGLK